MSARGLVGVRIGGQVVPLLPDHSVGVAEDDKPEEGFAFVRCDACGATARMATPVTYKFYDDDHYGRIEAAGTNRGMPVTAPPVRPSSRSSCPTP